jgi:hypothetical protein
MSATAFIRPLSAASLNDLSPLPPMSKTSPTLALLLTGATLAAVEDGEPPDEGAADVAEDVAEPVADPAADVAADAPAAEVAAVLALVTLVAAELAPPAEVADELPLELLLPHAATDMAETRPTAARRTARDVRTGIPFLWCSAATDSDRRK